MCKLVKDYFFDILMKYLDINMIIYLNLLFL